MKLLSIFILLPLFCFGQLQEKSEEKPRKNELHSNALDLVIAGTLNIGYERLFKKNQSLSIDLNFFDTYAYYDSRAESNSISYMIAYNLYFRDRKDHYGFYFYPMIRQRFGSQKLDTYEYYDDVTQTWVMGTEEQDLKSFLVGFGFGHKWLFSNKFSLSIYGNLGRELMGKIDENYFTKVEPRFGVNLGYRF